jgi:hypothetical protein
MADFLEITGEIGGLALELHALVGSAAPGSDLVSRIDSLAGRLRGHQLAAFAGGLDTEEIRSGIAAARAALELETAVRTLKDRDARAAGEIEARALLTRMGYVQCLAALSPLALAGEVTARSLLGSDGKAESRGAIAGASPSGPPDLRVLKEVSRVHRQHARYHSMHKYDAALEIARDAHRLKALADLWLAGGGPKPLEGVDFSDPRYRAAPCSDLNVPDAIPTMGFLFLEGIGKPPEMTWFEDRLEKIADDIVEFGAALTRSMDAAWVRESALFAPDRIAIAWPRLQVVLSNWRASHDSVLAARLLKISCGTLRKIDFTPKAIRARIKPAGAELSAVGWVMDMASQLCAAAGIALADNNWRYTQYSEFLEGVSRGA